MPRIAPYRGGQWRLICVAPALISTTDEKCALALGVAFVTKNGKPVGKALQEFFTIP